MSWVTFSYEGSLQQPNRLVSINLRPKYFGRTFKLGQLKFVSAWSIFSSFSIHSTSSIFFLNSKMRVVFIFVLSCVILASCLAKSSVGSSQLNSVSSKKGGAHQYEVVASRGVAAVSSGTTKLVTGTSISPSNGAVREALKLVGLFTLWYAFNAAYNVYNAFVKKDFQFPLTTAALQLFAGLFYAVPLWAINLRKFPKLTKDDFLKILPIAALNAFGHACAVCAMFERGGGSFTHVIKASEPVVSVILGLLVNGAVPKPLTALSLLPITYGVAYASTLGQLDVSTMSKELTTKAAKLAMGSNVAFSLRSILRKNTLTADFKVCNILYCMVQTYHRFMIIHFSHSCRNALIWMHPTSTHSPHSCPLFSLFHLRWRLSAWAT